MLFDVVILLIVIVVLLMFLQKHRFTYWKRRHVKQIENVPVLGNLKDLFLQRKSFGTLLWDIYNAEGFENEAVIGFYALQKPALLLRDVELIKRVMIKEFGLFVNRVITADPAHDRFGSNNLFMMGSSAWYTLRPKFSPIFTTAKTKQMYSSMIEICKELERHLHNLPAESSIDVLKFCRLFTTDLIALIGFGFRSNNLRNSESEFYKHCCSIFALTIKRGLDIAAALVSPLLVRLLRINFFDKKASDYLYSILKSIIRERERTGVCRNDLVDMLIAMRKNAMAKGEDFDSVANWDKIVGIAGSFQIGGFETASSTLTFALYEIAKHADVQDQLRLEINNALAEEESDCISYERIQQLTYLDQVVYEVLRMYPILPFLERKFVPIEGKKVFSLEPHVNVQLDAGTPVYVSSIGIMRDEKYWPNPENFDPDRFSPDNQQNINWNLYLPFGLGPRNCIGMRLGFIQVKLGLVHILKGHRVLCTERTPEKLIFDANAIILVSSESIHLKIQRVPDQLHKADLN